MCKHVGIFFEVFLQPIKITKGHLQGRVDLGHAYKQMAGDHGCGSEAGLVG
jgi:hypothetical protein